MSDLTDDPGFRLWLAYCDEKERANDAEDHVTELRAEVARLREGLEAIARRETGDCIHGHMSPAHCSRCIARDTLASLEGTNDE
jgi:hypothetical protein